MSESASAMESQIRAYLTDNPDKIDFLKRLVEYEEENIDDDHAFIEDKKYDSCWDYKDVSINPNTLYQLETKGIITRVFNSNSTTAYSIEDRAMIKKVVNELENQYDGSTKTVLHDFPSEEELTEKGIFDDVIGHDGAKFILRRAMSTDGIVNVLMVGPPGSAKTVFLMCINKLDKSAYISGKPTSGPGFMDKMFDETPRFMAIDELDKMDKKDQDILSEYTETGILVETKGNNKKRKMRTNTKTFAAANDVNKIRDHINNRFTDIHFDPYTYDEFIEVCEHILPRNEGKTVDEARKIAEAVWDFDGFGNVRKAIQAARLSKGDPDKVIRALEEYSSKNGLF